MTTAAETEPTPGDTDRRGDAWFPTVPEPTPRRLRKHALAAKVRTIVTGVSQLDTEGIGDDALGRLDHHLDALVAVLDETPDLRHAHGSASRAPGDDGALFERSPLTGRSNPLATPLELWFDGDRTLGTTTFDEAYEGPPGTVHGGFVISAFDDLLGVAQAASGLAGVTGTLTVRLHRPTPLHERIDYEARVDGREGRKILLSGRAYHDGSLLAEADGVFIARPG